MDELLIQLFVYLAVAAVAAPLAKQAGLGAVLGYLIAGVVIGPFAFGLVGDVEDVAHVGEFGVVILLFIIGLEVRPSLLWSMRTAIFGVGAAQMAATAAAVLGIALALGLDLRTASVVALLLPLSSTAVALQLLEERGLRRGQVGSASFGVLLFQDLAVIPILALLPLMTVTGGGAGHAAEEGLLAGQGAGVRAAAALAAIAALVVGGRYLTRPIFRAIAKARLREAFTAFALLIVVGAALLMEMVGLSPALGAFLAGVLLADSEFRREVETDIEPFRGLLLGLFFITVGAGLNLPLIAAEPARLLGLVLGLLLLKGLIMFAVARAFRLNWREAGSTAAALCQGGEFIFVLSAAALSFGLLEPDLAATITAAVALSMAATPLVMIAWQAMARPRNPAAEAPVNTFDEEAPEAIIAGYGRFGQIVTRVLSANRFRVSMLDVSVEQIELLRRFGRQVYYGDAARLDLLRAAGAEKAKILVVAIDDKEKAGEIVEAAREAFPHLTILARAFDRRHAYDLLDKGAEIVERETFEGGLAMAAQALRALGWRAYRAERAARLFRRHDERMFDQLRPLWGDEERYVVASRESSPRMDDLLRADLNRIAGADAAGEDGGARSLYDEIRENAALTEREDGQAEPQRRPS